MVLLCTAHRRWRHQGDIFKDSLSWVTDWTQQQCCSGLWLTNNSNSHSFGMHEHFRCMATSSYYSCRLLLLMKALRHHNDCCYARLSPDSSLLLTHPVASFNRPNNTTATFTSLNLGRGPSISLVGTCCSETSDSSGANRKILATSSLVVQSNLQLALVTSDEQLVAWVTTTQGNSSPVEGAKVTVYSSMYNQVSVPAAAPEQTKHIGWQPCMQHTIHAPLPILIPKLLHQHAVGDTYHCQQYFITLHSRPIKTSMLQHHQTSYQGRLTLCVCCHQTLKEAP